MIKPYQNEARFRYSLWLSAGKPIQSPVPGVEHDLFTLKKSSKNQYHFAIRRAQKRLNLIENDKIISKMGSQDLFEEIKKSCKDKKSDITSVIDDVHGAENISNYFKEIYERLYNEQDVMDNDVINSLHKNVTDHPIDSMEALNLFTADLVKSAVKKL